jgi:hypothetical protein
MAEEPGDERGAEPLHIVATRLPLDKTDDPGIAHVLELWNRRRGAHALPPRNAIKPEELKPVLGKVNLLAVQRDPLRFVFRVRGSVIANLHDRDMTGRGVAEMQPPEYRDMLIRHYTEAVELAAPTLYMVRQSRGAHDAVYRRIILPLGTPDGVVEMLLTVSAWERDFPGRTEKLGFKHRR